MTVYTEHETPYSKQERAKNRERKAYQKQAAEDMRVFNDKWH